MTTIMIVDDEEDIRDLAEEALQWDEHNVIKARNGETALEMLEEKTPDLILLDIDMPGLDGWETLDEMERQGLTEDTPAIMVMVEGLTFVRVLKEDIEGLVGYVEKPFERKELADLIRDHVSKAREIMGLSEKIRDSPEGGESLAEAYKAWSRSILIHRRFLEKLNEMRESSTDERKLARIKNMKKGEKEIINHLEQKKKEIHRMAGVEKESSPVNEISLPPTS